MTEDAHGNGKVGKENGNKNREVIKTQVLKHLQGAGESERGGNEKDVRRGATAVGIVKSWGSRPLRGRRSEEIG